MTARYFSRLELANKIDWEGGLESFLDYGFGLGDLPEEDEALRTVAARLLFAWDSYQAIAQEFEDLLPEPGDEIEVALQTSSEVHW